MTALCSDVSDNLTPINCTSAGDAGDFKNCTTRLDTLEAYYFDNGNASIPMTMSTTMTQGPGETKKFVYTNTSLAVIQAIYGVDVAPKFANFTYKATECALYPCVQSITSRVGNGTFNETVNAEWLGPVTYNDDASERLIYKINPPFNGSLGLPKNASNTFAISNEAWTAVRTYFEFAFQGRVESTIDDGMSATFPNPAIALSLPTKCPSGN